MVASSLHRYIRDIRNNIYPSGTPYRLPETGVATDITARTDQLHIGNRWIGHKGLNIYDNTARLHDPVLMRFHTPDPLYASYPPHSPWSHCAANPLAFIDPDGERPTDLEGACICEHVYLGKVGDILEGEWEMDLLIPNRVDGLTSFRAGLYSRTLEDGNKEFAVAFAGTFTDYRMGFSHIQDVLQIFGLSTDVFKAQITGIVTDQMIGGQELTFLGHSKGGVEAIAGALLTGNEAMVYNPAKISERYVPYMCSPKVTNYIVEGEFISKYVPDRIGWFGPLSQVGYVGEIQKLQAPKGLNTVQKHSISTVIDILKSTKR